MWQETSTPPRSVHAEHNLQTLSSPDSIFTNVRGFAKVQAEFWLRAKEKKRCLSHGDKMWPFNCCGSKIGLVQELKLKLVGNTDR